MKTPRPLTPPPARLLALDPSLRGTGWVVVMLRTAQITAAGVIVTRPPEVRQRKQRTAAENALRSGVEIFTAVSTLMRHFRPVVVAQEAVAGSKSVSAAAGLARAQQACGDAIYTVIGSYPLFATQQAVKKRATGYRSASKETVEWAMRTRWATSDFEALLTTPPPYAAQGQRLPPRGQWANAFDAAAVAHCVWDEPAVAAARAMAR